MDNEELKQAFIQWLFKKSGVQSEQEFSDFVRQLGEEGIQQAYQQFLQEAGVEGADVQSQEAVRSARNGAKLDYIDYLNTTASRFPKYRRGGSL